LHDFLDTAEKIQSIVAAIERKIKAKFTRGVYVTLAETGLETTTAEIVSEKETTKFRMHHWSPANFDALLDVSHHLEPDLVKTAVHSTPVLENLATNARCAFFLLRHMDDASAS
jgi:hypothetical protein